MSACAIDESIVTVSRLGVDVDSDGDRPEMAVDCRAEVLQHAMAKVFDARKGDDARGLHSTLRRGTEPQHFIGLQHPVSECGIQVCELRARHQRG